MKKVRLDVDMLSVETFSTTGGAADARGTVNANGDPTQGDGGGESLDYCPFSPICPMSGGGGEGGSCLTECGTCAANTYCGTCETECGSYDPYCC